MLKRKFYDTLLEWKSAMVRNVCSLRAQGRSALTENTEYASTPLPADLSKNPNWNEQPVKPFARMILVAFRAQLVLFCCCVCLVCVGSIVAEKATVEIVDYILKPYNSFVRGIIGGQELMGNVLLGLGLMFVGIFVYCAVAVIVVLLLIVLSKALLPLWRKHNPVNPVNETPAERLGSAN